MSDPYLIESLTLSGFRAYLRPQTFDLSVGRCLGVFAPNAWGKSSLVDGVEFYFSTDGTLERLGAKAINNQAGPSALKHILADEMGVTSEVAMTLRKGKAKPSGARSTDGKRPITPAGEEVRASIMVDPIVRGPALRSFVETQTPEARYASVARWLQLGPLVEVQRNLRALRQQVKAASEDLAQYQRIEQQVARDTRDVVKTWNETDVLRYANSAMAALDRSLSLTALDPSAAGYETLIKRATQEESQLGLTSLKHLKTCAEVLHRDATPVQAGDEAEPTSLIASYEDALGKLAEAKANEKAERTKAEKAVFVKVWEAAQPLFAPEVDPPIACPLCDTVLDKTAAGSADGVRQHLASHLAELQEYRCAEAALETAKTTAQSAKQELTGAVQALVNQKPPDALRDRLAAYRVKLETGAAIAATETATLKAQLTKYIEQIDGQIGLIEARQGDATYAKVLALVVKLMGLKDERELAERTKAELERLCMELNTQAELISTEIRKAIQALLDSLNTPMNVLYREIQGAKARPVRLELPAEDEKNQQRLQLVVDFAKNRQGVQPGGYLSDSQVHSLALAFRMAAIRQFNTGARFVLLDDIVTSYDADHRRAISALIAKHMGNLQILLVTHDERFFNYLQEQLELKRWRFTRIVRLDPDYGPRFGDVRIADELIQQRWAVGESAANDMRQAEEEWLLGICRGFGVDIRIRPLERPYSFERSELASALAAFLKKRGLVPPLIPGVNNPFLHSLVSGTVENFGSHFQDDPNSYGSGGDEQTRWAEFTAFRDLFACPACKRTRFKRPMLEKPVCAHEGCETQFGFRAPATMEPA